MPENLHQISNADKYSGAARTELSRGSQELLNILFQRAAYKRICGGLTVWPAISAAICERLEIPGLLEVKGRGSRGLTLDTRRHAGGGVMYSHG